MEKNTQTNYGMRKDIRKDIRQKEVIYNYETRMRRYAENEENWL